MATVILLSGGIDSTATTDFLARRDGTADLTALSLFYGQRHKRELAAARQVADHYGIRHTILDISGFLHGSALLDPDMPVPHGHYADESMAQTVVQGRNLLFVGIATGLAQPGDSVAISVHAGDHPIYPDCRPDFIQPLRKAMCAAYDVKLHSPWINMTKADIVRARPDAPYHLSWSCYEGGDVHCGKCGTCVERIEAFRLAGVPDPTRYAGDAVAV